MPALNPIDIDSRERHRTRDEKIALRHAMLDAIRKIGRPATSQEIAREIAVRASAQAISMAADREPSYFRITEGWTNRKDTRPGRKHYSRGANRLLLIDLHPHLKVSA